MSDDENLRKEIERLRSENEALRSKSSRNLRLQVSEKGAASLYGLRRFPVTLYKEEWLEVLDMADEIRAFLVENDAKLTKRRGGK